MKLTCRVLFTFLLLSALSSHARAQQVTATLRGTAFDPSGATVASASIAITQIETGYSRTASTDSQGNFVLVELPVGHYRVAADAKGFQRFVSEGLILEVNQTAFIAVHLTIGSGS